MTGLRVWKSFSRIFLVFSTAVRMSADSPDAMRSVTAKIACEASSITSFVSRLRSVHFSTMSADVSMSFRRMLSSRTRVA